ncbi:MAG TPA: DUF2157 domain-containing protein [Bryobacteraceae bacterium]|jgi:uncharacterized membrane protein
MEEISRRWLARSGLSPQAIDLALSLSGLRPSLSEWREFAVRVMRLAGILSLAAGMIFLVAFNWDSLGTYARFGSVEVPLLAALLIAWIKGADRLPGKLALMLAVLLTGALLALFGETYQTGADVYELFLGWAVLSLPWVVACRYAPCWGLWLLLANAAVGLYSGTNGQDWFLIVFRDRMHWSPWTLPFLLNLLLYITIVRLSAWKDFGLADAWLRRGVMAIAMMFGTFIMIYRISDGGGQPGTTLLEVILFLVASVAFASHAFSRKDDLFNFAVLALAWIAVTSTLLARAIIDAGLGAALVLALYVIGTSTAAVKGIGHIGRQWRLAPAPLPSPPSEVIP